jgi:mono/diheme cytochrome c family protein
MYNQPRYDVQEKSNFFADGRTMRPEVPGTMSVEQEVDPEIATGRSLDGQSWIARVPQTVIDRNGGNEAFVTRGQNRYGIYCTPCHSLAGDGMGMVARRAEELGAAALKPPTFHSNRLRHIPDGQLFSTITNGVRNMPAYRHNIPVDDRWAIVLYVRALQLTNVDPAAVPDVAASAQEPSTP